MHDRGRPFSSCFRERIRQLLRIVAAGYGFKTGTRPGKKPKGKSAQRLPPGLHSIPGGVFRTGSADAAIPLLKEIQQEFGSERVTVAIENFRTGTNGKINNMIGGLKHARHDILVISDSDVFLKPDYLQTIVAPLANPEVGCTCTLYKAAGADRWFEKIELLTLNADFMANVLFAHVTGASRFCLGASAALHRSTLERIGGFEGLADYLVEDYEMGRRIWELGKKVEIIPYFVDTVVDLKRPSQWWSHQVYWDQNTRAARPFAFFATALVRSVPFALLFAAARMGDSLGLSIMAGAYSVEDNFRCSDPGMGAQGP